MFEVDDDIDIVIEDKDIRAEHRAPVTCHQNRVSHRLTHLWSAIVQCQNDRSQT